MKKYLVAAVSVFVVSIQAYAQEQGKELFLTGAKPIACAVCHTLADAGSAGAIGPDLDELKPGKEQILKVMKEGMGAMPSFAQTMSDEERDAVATYVSSVAGQ
ncbi:cytochrome c [Alcaligenes sp. AB3]|uniref:SorU family sulfite dehydrogenase c-type cytochrome subunit n=1 Tax=Alcaligenes TaxID=507 RepID=UPI00208EE0E8|nr:MULTISPECIES: cytochrome c [Alcaligenes]MDT0217502.1 cytochrome c [Alcaligenes sp. AB3]USP49304.1 cytochrome c [Alcaligenes faecalis]